MDTRWTLVNFKRVAAVGAALTIVASVLAVTAGNAAAQAPVMCGGEVATIVGSPAADRIIGTPGDDVIAALQGNDVVRGGAGNDIICGGLGDDLLYGGMGFDVIYGAQGDDLLVASTKDLRDDTAGSRMFGGAGNDVMRGSARWDRMQGGAGNDELYGEGSRDWLRGGRGDDLIDGGAWKDDINAGYGNDEIFIDGADFVRGGPGKKDVCRTGGNATDATILGCERIVVGSPPPSQAGTITMGRANWSSGYVQAAILHDLLEEAGYDVTEPADAEFSPDLGYQAMALGEIDFWANSWYPGHLSWWERELPDGTQVGDNLARVEGSLLPGGGRQGMLITKSWAEENGVTTLDQINDDPALWSQLDTDGNGKGEFFGCPRDWTCDEVMDSMIAFAGWDNLEQITAGYDAMLTVFLEKAEAGEPAIAYTWTPTSYFADAKPGDTTMWLSVNESSVLDNSNPLGLANWDDSFFCQTCGDEIGFSDLEPGTCLEGPDGCQLGWAASDIEITANKEWLAKNPVAAEMFNQFKPPLIDIAIAGVALDASNFSTAAVNEIAADWIADNRALADSWVAAAKAAR